jgi:short-subunit dehydrogenase
MDEWVLITGASRGIGYAFAKRFAQAGHKLVLLARDEALLKDIAAELKSQYRIETRVLAKDLSAPNASREVFEELQRAQVNIGILVNNAGFGFQGPFAKVDSKRHLELLQVNMSALVQLTHLFLPAMLARRSGRIMNIASTASFLPGPSMAMYYASKAFVKSLSLALSAELEGSGVTVTVVHPGLTRSEFHKRSGSVRPRRGIMMMEADVVADMGYRATMSGRREVVTGWINKLVVLIAWLVPVRVMMGLVMRANSAQPRSEN